MREFKASEFFPDPRSADENGLLLVEPRFSVARMLDAYRHGIFPWPVRQEGQGHAELEDEWFVGWYCPESRAILPMDELHIPRRLARKLSKGQFRFSWNQRFSEVIDACASVGTRKQEAWLSPELVAVIEALHDRGLAHSIEVYDVGGQLCGGLYGIASGGVFAAESMYHVKSDASKAAICGLVALLSSAGFRLLDVQLPSNHLKKMGAVEISRSEFLSQVRDVVYRTIAFPRPPHEPMLLCDLSNASRTDA